MKARLQVRLREIDISLQTLSPDCGYLVLFYSFFFIFTCICVMRTHRTKGMSENYSGVAGEGLAAKNKRVDNKEETRWREWTSRYKVSSPAKGDKGRWFKVWHPAMQSLKLFDRCCKFTDYFNGFFSAILIVIRTLSKRRHQNLSWRTLIPEGPIAQPWLAHTSDIPYRSSPLLWLSNNDSDVPLRRWGVCTIPQVQAKESPIKWGSNCRWHATNKKPRPKKTRQTTQKHLPTARFIYKVNNLTRHAVCISGRGGTHSVNVSFHSTSL